MKKTFFILVVLVVILLCMFPMIAFCNNTTTEVRINVYEIKVNCDKNGSFVVNENKFINEESFFVGEDASMNITAIAKDGYIVDSIECEPQCNSTFKNSQLVITNITDNINVKITFKPTEIQVGGEDNQIIKDNNEEQENIGIWLIIVLICVSLTIFYLIYKKKNKN